MKKNLLDLCREIQAISKSGLAFSKDPFDIERFEQLEGIASQLISEHSLHSKEFIGKVFSAEEGYATPKIDVRAAIFKEDKLLMVKENVSDSWTLPGGYVDVNESLSSAIEREVLEESGIQVESKKVAAIYDHRKHGYKAHLYHFYKIFLICEYSSGDLKTNIETSDVKYFSEEEIEKLSLDPGRITRAHALRMFDHHRDYSIPTDFD